MLVKLKAAVVPRDEYREMKMILYYCKFRTPPGTKALESWLHFQEPTYADATSINLPDMAGDRAIIDFLLAIKVINPASYCYWAWEVEQTVQALTLPDMVNKF
jgi:hypothetical protein